MDLSYFIFLSSGLFLGWSLGANDAANVFGTAVGTKMVRFRTAAVISSFFLILGAVYSGGGTTETLTRLGNVNALPGAFMVALSAAVSVYWMIKGGLPVSTSQAIVGAIVGWNFYSGRPTDLSIVSKIVSTWVICPVLAGILATLIYFLVRSLIKYSKIHLIRQDLYTRIGLIVAGAFGAYALGANNIANVMGVFVDSAPFQNLKIGNLTFSPEQILFFIGGIAVSSGIFSYSHKIIKTIGNGLMRMSPIVAWIVVVSQSLVLYMFASEKLENFLLSNGLPALPLVPVSSSQAVIGAIIGIGLAKGGRSISWSILGHIALGWIFTPIMAALLCFISLFFLENVFNLVVYLAVMGREGMRQVAEQCVSKAHYLAKRLTEVKGVKLKFDGEFFHEFAIETDKYDERLEKALAAKGILGGLRLDDGTSVWCATEKASKCALDAVADAFAEVK